MKIKLNKIDEKSVEVTLEGELNNVTVSELEKELNQNIHGIKSLQFNLEKLSYIYTAGLKLLLNVQKLMNIQNGKMSIVKTNSKIRKIFEVTGAVDILVIK